MQQLTSQPALLLSQRLHRCAPLLANLTWFFTWDESVKLWSQKKPPMSFSLTAASLVALFHPFFLLIIHQPEVRNPNPQLFVGHLRCKIANVIPSSLATCSSAYQPMVLSSAAFLALFMSSSSASSSSSSTRSLHPSVWMQFPSTDLRINTGKHELDTAGGQILVHRFLMNRRAVVSSVSSGSLHGFFGC